MNQSIQGIPLVDGCKGLPIFYIGGRPTPQEGRISSWTEHRVFVRFTSGDTAECCRPEELIFEPESVFAYPGGKCIVTKDSPIDGSLNSMLINEHINVISALMIQSNNAPIGDNTLKNINIQEYVFIKQGITPKQQNELMANADELLEIGESMPDSELPEGIVADYNAPVHSSEVFSLRENEEKL